MKITLDTVRQAKGLSLEDVAEGCKLPLKVVEQAHQGFGDVAISVGRRLLEFYSVPARLIDLD